MAEREELFDDLRAAWNVFPPPDDDLERPDPLTRAVVQWMESAWRELPVPELARPRQRRSWWRRTPRLVRVAAALMITCLAGITLWWGSGASPSGPDHGGGPRIDEADDVAPTVRVAAATAERVELASGPVRLVLVAPEPFDQPEPMENRP